MVIELVLLFAFAVAIGVAVVKVIEWRMDVLDHTSPRSSRNKNALDRSERAIWSLVSSLQLFLLRLRSQSCSPL